ncbi:uncharacterized protein A4U43_C07F7850 [Asparagus officinalis]|uniref:Uncharacterized protein n=1 Tax=Asparagus officinalis TaxID=4686 RepID=A0A5P1EFB5_ASPOF|nr:uncharacterized protein A4U43_C07F7850 [Asparagus officinalis]
MAREAVRVCTTSASYGPLCRRTTVATSASRRLLDGSNRSFLPSSLVKSSDFFGNVRLRSKSAVPFILRERNDHGQRSMKAIAAPKVPLQRVERHFEIDLYFVIYVCEVPLQRVERHFGTEELKFQFLLTLRMMRKTVKKEKKRARVNV